MNSVCVVFLYQYIAMRLENLSAAAFSNDKDEQSSSLLSVFVSILYFQIPLSQHYSLTNLPNITALAENEADWQPEHCHLAVVLCQLSVTVLHWKLYIKKKN